VEAFLDRISYNIEHISPTPMYDNIEKEEDNITQTMQITNITNTETDKLIQ